MPTRGLNFDTLPTCDSHRYYTITHLSLSHYSNTKYVKNKNPNRSKHSHSNLEHEEHTQKSKEHEEHAQKHEEHTKNLKNYKKLNTKTISNTGPNPELTDQPKAFPRAKFLCKCKSGFGK